MRVALYARVSTKDKGQDTENQLLQMREFALRSGWSIVAEFVDRESAKSGDRAELKAMLRDASRRKFDALLVWALDRLTREGIEATFAYIRQLKDARVDFISYTEAHFRTTGPAGELMLALAAWIAEQERLRMSERTKAGLARARREGRIGGRPRLIVSHAKIHKLREKGKTTREIGEVFGISAASVCRILNTGTTQPA